MEARVEARVEAGFVIICDKKLARGENSCCRTRDENVLQQENIQKPKTYNKSPSPAIMDIFRDKETPATAVSTRVAA